MSSRSMRHTAGTPAMDCTFCRKSQRGTGHEQTRRSGTHAQPLSVDGSLEFLHGDGGAALTDNDADSSSRLINKLAQSATTGIHQ